MTTFTFDREDELSAIEFVDLLERATLAERRPVGDLQRVEGMLHHADVVVTARNEQRQLIGVSRAITDYHYCTYLSDLAVDVKFQRQGVGRKLIEETHRIAGHGTHLILLSAPAAKSYYPHIGMEANDSCWWIRGQ